MKQPPTVDRSADAELRARLGKLVGVLARGEAVERSSAVDAISRTLANAGLSWGWLSLLISFGSPFGRVEQTLARVVVAYLQSGVLQGGWAMTGDESRFVAAITARLKTGLADLSAAELERAVAIVDEALRRTGSPAAMVLSGRGVSVS
jgi:hypothetical protein